MIGGIYAEDLLWIVAVYIFFFICLIFYFSKSLSRVENISQGGEKMEISKERRKKKLWWQGAIALFFGYCQVCEKKRGSFIADGKRKQDDGFIMICEECSSNFPEAIKREEVSPTNNMEMF